MKVTLNIHASFGTLKEGKQVVGCWTSSTAKTGSYYLSGSLLKEFGTCGLNFVHGRGILSPALYMYAVLN